MKPVVIACIGLALAACSPGGKELMGDTQPGAQATVAPPPAPPAPSIEGIPAGAYKLDPSHASLLFRVSHLGFSHYTAQFTKFDVSLDLDPANPSAAKLTATVDATSLQLPSPPAGFTDEIKGEHWLDAGQFPVIKFVSTDITTTGANTAKVTGDLTLHGVTKPVMLEMTFNGGYGGNTFDPNARVGFSAHGTFKRSDFGISYGIPEPGSNMGVGDEVEVIIETEFSGPAVPAQPTAPASN
jgi:polyisoprenoid-binding protein YceI